MNDSWSADLVSLLEVALRATVLFVVTIVLVRLASRRFLGRYAAFDIVLAIILGSIVARGITGTASVPTTITASAMLLALHWGCSWLAFRYAFIRHLLKGRPIALLRDGVVKEASMRRALITRDDLAEELRHEAQIGRLEELESAHLECNGHLSAVRKRPQEKQ
jgi:uncharacterized membrane protein YcaP (DUF421 family)